MTGGSCQWRTGRSLGLKGGRQLVGGAAVLETNDGDSHENEQSEKRGCLLQLQSPVQCGRLSNKLVAKARGWLRSDT